MLVLMFLLFADSTDMKWPSASSVRIARAAGGFFMLLLLVLTCLPGGGVSVGAKSNQMGPVTQCAMSEHTCTNGKCIPLNKYCDNRNDCGDGSDEPRFCTSKCLTALPCRWG